MRERLVTVQPMTLAFKKSAAYRDRQREDNAWRLQVYLPAEYRQLVEDTAERLGVTNKAALQFLIDTGGMMFDDLTPELALSLAPEKARPLLRQQFLKSGAIKDGMTDAERVQLEQFKVELANQNVTARHLQAHGGQEQLDRQNKIAASWTAGNIHNTK